MAIFGWVVLCLVLGGFSLAYLMVCFNNFGIYNIGGVPNSFQKKFWTFVGLMIVAFFWWQLFENAPFTVTLNTN